MSVAFVTFILYGQIREVCMAGGQDADGQDGRGRRAATGMRVFLYHVILQLELDVDVDVLT